MWQSVASGERAMLVMPSPSVSCSQRRAQCPGDGAGAGNGNGVACLDGVQHGGAST
jgi:hypothetical protein